MGLDAAIYADDDCEKPLATIRIGNAATVAHLHEHILQMGIDAPVVLEKVLASGTHCGDALTTNEAGLALAELNQLTKRGNVDPYVKQFIEVFGRLCLKAIELRRPITF